MIGPLSNIFPKTRGAYLVGGSIRDHLLGKTPLDYDIVVSENPRKYARQIALKMPGHLVEIGKPGQTVVRVVSESVSVDVSALNARTIAEDMQKRDFTINAMAYELSSEKLIDDVGGQQDLSKQVIRMVSPRVFVSDPVRLLRAYRLAACLSFVIEPKTKSAIKRYADLIQQSAGERIRDELFKMLQADTSFPSLSQMADSELLFKIFPELLNLKKRPAFNSRHRYALEDTLSAFYHLENLFKDPYQFLPRSLEACYQSLKGIDKALLKFCILWHDIGLPSIQVQTHNAPAPETKSARLAQDICKRFRISNRHTDCINLIIQNHTRPFSLFKAYQNKILRRNDLIRFLMKCADQTPGLMLHALAEMYAKQKSKSAKSRAFLEFVIHMLQDEYTGFKAKAALPSLITGSDLINQFGLRPSPLFKKLLRVIEEERLARKTMTRTDALRMVQKFLAELESGN
jgi:tRNA nucleotidyltransferase/poly(A) polymerase